jgi:hypothetical protein
MLILPHGMETEAGTGGDMPPDAVRSIEAAAVRLAPAGPKPAALGCKQFEAGKTAEDVVRRVLDLARRHPCEATFLEAQSAINELGRSPEGTAVVRRFVTPEVVGEIAARGCKGGPTHGA